MAEWYQKLEERQKKIAMLNEVSELLDWDSRICLAENSNDRRGEQKAAISGMIHEEMTNPEWQKIFENAEKETDLNEWQKANLLESKRRFIHASCIPKSLVEKQAKTVNACNVAWFKARKENDFKSFAPHLQKVLTITREIAAIKAEKLGCSPYDALLDEYQPGLKSEQVDELFGELKSFLPDTIKDITTKQQAENRPESGFSEEYSEEKQKEFLTKIMNQMGFDFSKGRLDRASSAFCVSMGEDTRVVSRFDEKNPLRAVMSGMHETGHALYEQGLPQEWREQPVGQPMGLGLHESQSLLMVSQVYQSPEFMSYLTSEMHKAYGTEETKPENLKAQISKVEPSLIRINADDATYPLHVIMRYEIEKDLVEGKMEVADLPKAWKEKTKEYLGIEPPNDSQGCLQDVHWSSGNFGYFPNYAIGSIAAAQIFEAAKKQHPEIGDELANGEFKTLKKWLNDNIHSQGSLKPFNKLIEDVTGEKLSTKALKRSLETKYLQPSKKNTITSNNKNQGR